MTDRPIQKEVPAEVLVVDDIPENLKLLADILTDWGYRVRPASSGRLALKSVAARPPDLILLDVRMPGMDGYEVCRHLKSDEKSRDVPVIFISALNDVRDKVEGFDAGGVDFITKPFQSREVLARVQTHLALRGMQEQLRAQNARLQQEIAERKQVEEALRQSESTYRALFENTGTALAILDESALISFANSRFEKLSGYSRNELEGRKIWTDFVSGEDPERIEKHHTPGRPIPRTSPGQYELRFVDRRGNIRNVIANFSMIPGTAKSVASLMDITELRHKEAELQRARKFESIGILAGGIAHDFNNLLGIIAGNISLVRYFTDCDPEVEGLLKGSEKACYEARDLTQRLIAFSFGPEPRRKPQSIRGLVQDAVDLVLRDSNVRCKLDLPRDLLPVDCDPLQIRQMITSLAKNAEEATADGGIIEVSARNEQVSAGSVLSLNEGRYVRLSIKDHGKGIPEDLIPKVFDPYFSTKERGSQKGMGLGLTMAYAIARSHNGHIDLESGVGVGTTLSVYLPAFVERTS